MNVNKKQNFELINLNAQMKFDSPYLIVVRPEDRIQAGIYFNLIKTLIQVKANIPFNIADAFLKLLQDGDNFEFDQLSKEARLISDKAVEMLRKRRGYMFSGQSKKLYEEFQDFKNLSDLPEGSPKTEITVSYNFEEIIPVIVLAFLHFKRDKKGKVRKLNALRFYIEALHEYSPLFNKNDFKAFTNYKKGAIASILARCSGYKVSKKPNPSNDDYFQAARNTLENLEKLGKLQSF